MSEPVKRMKTKKRKKKKQSSDDGAKAGDENDGKREPGFKMPKTNDVKWS